MDLLISNSRIRLLSDEFRGVNFNFDPSNTNIISHLWSNQNRTKDFYRILSFGVISKYISVKLNNDIKAEINAFKHSIVEYSLLKKEFPEIELLFLLNETGKELPITQTEYVEFFEKFLILDRSFRNNDSIKKFLDFIGEEKAGNITDYKDVFDLFAENKNEEDLSKKKLSENNRINEAVFSVLYGFTELNDFMFELRVFFRNYNEDFPIAFCCLFYEELFTKLKKHAETIEKFYQIILKWTVEGLFSQIEIALHEKEEIEKEMEEYLIKARDTFYWLIRLDKLVSQSLIKDVYQHIYV